MQNDTKDNRAKMLSRFKCKAIKGFVTASILLVSTVAFSQLSGNYTIDGAAAASATNYTTFSSAVEDMLFGTRADGGAVNGPDINAAVTFDVADGTYNEKVAITAITGSSSTNTVTFQSASGDSTAVTVTSAASSPNYMFQINGASYINFHQLHIYKNNSFNMTCFEIVGGSSNIGISNCFIEGKNASTGGVAKALIRSQTGVDNDISITGNRFFEGATAVYMFGTSGVHETGLVISNNEMEQVSDDAIYLRYNDDVTVDNNTAFDGGNVLGSYGFYLQDCAGGNSISYNDISGLFNEGIRLLDVVSTMGDPTLIYNNSIVHTSTAFATRRAIYLDDAEYIDVAHNSTYVSLHASATGSALYILAGSSNITANNNVFYSARGYGINDSGSGLTQSDRNVVHNTTGSLMRRGGSNYATLALWQAATSLDANSVSGDPLYTSVTTDLRLMAGSPAIDLGLPIAGLATDLDGIARDATPDAGAYEFVPVVVCTEDLELVINTDNNGNETTWELRPDGSATPVASGGSYPNNAVIIENICVPVGCYVLEFFDSMGDGIASPGGYILRTITGDRLIISDGQFGASSQVSGAPICLPIGTDRLILDHCDRMDFQINNTLIASENSAVSAEFGVNDVNSGYQFWLFDPHGTYARRVFYSHANTIVGVPSGPLAAAHLKFSSLLTNPIQTDLLLNVRVRGRVNGVNSEFGPACQLMVLSAPVACPTTQLIDDPNHVFFSCGVIKEFGGSDKVVAQPVLGANFYKFRFENAGEGFVRNIAGPSYARNLGWATLPLQDGVTYDVTVQASFDGGANYCPVGAVCQVTIMNPPVAQTRELDESNVFGLAIWPNPNRGDNVYLSIDELGEYDEISVEIYDVFGKRVHSEVFANQGSSLNTVLSLDGDLSNGMYIVNVIVGNDVITERLIIQ